MSSVQATACPVCRAPMYHPDVCLNCGRSTSQPSVGAGAPQPMGLQAPRRSSFTVGTILLVLGAGFLLLAAIAFLTASWDYLGLPGKIMVVAVFMVAFAGLAAVLTLRKLRGSAEALWVIAFGMLVFDWFAVWRYLRVSDVVDVRFGLCAGILAIVVAALASLVAAFGRARLGKAILGASILSVAYMSFAFVATFWALCYGLEWRFSWSVLTIALVSCALAAFAKLNRDQVQTWGWFASVVIAGVLFALAAAVELLVSGSFKELTLNLHGLPALCLVIGSIVVALIWRKLAPAAVAIATVYASLLAVTPMFHIGHGTNGFFWSLVGLSAVLAVLAGIGIVSHRAFLGVRIGAGIFVLPGLLVFIVELFTTLGLIVVQWGSVGYDNNGLSWLEPVLFGSLLTASVALLSYWDIVRRYVSRPAAAMASIFVAAAGAFTTIATIGLVGWAPPVAALVASLALLAVAWRRHVAYGFIALAALVASAVFASADPLVAGGTVLGIAVIAAINAVAANNVWIRASSVVVSAVTGPLAAYLLADALGATMHARTLSLVIVAALMAFLARFSGPVRVTIEAVAAALGIGMAFTEVLDDSLSWAALLLVVMAVLVGVLAVVLKDRRWYAFVVPGLLFGAWLLFMIDNGVTEVEVVSLPIALALLGAGGAWLHYRSPNTWLALGPGLLIAFLPSLPQALVDPTGLRAALLLLAAAMAIVVAVWRSWQAPFAIGAATVALLLIANLGALGFWQLKWWLFAPIGVVLLVMGIRWEITLQRGKAAAHWLGSMR